MVNLEDIMTAYDALYDLVTFAFFIVQLFIVISHHTASITDILYLAENLEEMEI